MTDAVVLIALAQVISFGGLLYLYVQVQSLSARTSFSPLDQGKHEHHAAGHHPAPKAAQGTEAILARLSELDVDVPAMARRMHKSEEEIRLLLRRQSAGRSG